MSAAAAAVVSSPGTSKHMENCSGGTRWLLWRWRWCWKRLLGRKNINKMCVCVAVTVATTVCWLWLSYAEPPYHKPYRPLLLPAVCASGFCIPIKSHRSLMVPSYISGHGFHSSVRTAVITSFLFMFCNCVALYWYKHCATYSYVEWVSVGFDSYDGELCLRVCVWQPCQRARHFKCDADKNSGNL